MQHKHNIFTGHAHLTDFNIATIIKDGERATALAGTKPYMGKTLTCYSFKPWKPLSLAWSQICLWRLANSYGHCHNYDKTDLEPGNLIINILCKCPSVSYGLDWV